LKKNKKATPCKNRPVFWRETLYGRIKGKKCKNLTSLKFNVEPWVKKKERKKDTTPPR